MFIDALRWNMVNVIRVELFFNVYRIWNIFVKSSLQSQRGQYAIASLLVSLFAMLAVEFNLTWLLTFYSCYLCLGMCVWLHRRVYFYHRRLDTGGLNSTLSHLDPRQFNANGTASSVSSSGSSNSSTGGEPAKGLTGTLRHSDKHHSSSGNNHSGGVASGNGGSGEYTNSLHRQRRLAYLDFQAILSEPRQTHKQFALSLVHLSQAAELVGDKDVFDEMHFQILATRRDVVNIILRALLITAATLLAYLR